MATLRITRDGETVAENLADDGEVRRWFIQHTPYSQSHAMEHEGYGVEPETEYCLLSTCRDPNCRCHTAEIAPNE